MISPEKYRDPWLAEKFGEYIGFYTREFFCLDNFSSFALVYEGVRYATVEHAYQSLKFAHTAPDIAARIADCFSAYEAQKIAHENIDKQDPRWEERKLSLMERLLRAKLEQNPYVRKKLLQTGDCRICEDSPEDDYWGIGPTRKGMNHMGDLWMKLREEVKKGLL